MNFFKVIVMIGVGIFSAGVTYLAMMNSESNNGDQNNSDSGVDNPSESDDDAEASEGSDKATAVPVVKSNSTKSEKLEKLVKNIEKAQVFATNFIKLFNDLAKVGNTFVKVVKMYNADESRMKRGPVVLDDRPYTYVGSNGEYMRPAVPIPYNPMCNTLYPYGGATEDNPYPEGDPTSRTYGGRVYGYGM